MTVEEDMRRLEELAVSRLLEPLSTDEADEYAALKARLRHDDGAIEKLVALAHLALLPATQPAPRALRAAVEKDADEFFGTRYRSSSHAATPRLHERAHWASSAGWWVGLAATIVAVVTLVHRPPAVRGSVAENVAENNVARPVPVVVAPVVPAPAAPPKVEPQSASPDANAVDIASEWRAFLASHPRAIQRAWREGGDATGEGVVGEVVWDEASQAGYMRFVNLRHNEPNAEQYQLWIFDGARDQRYPVDGGVFDVTSPGGEQIVRIHANLPVQVPLVFAVTVEHPGGVVVSDRTRIAAIADVS